MQKFVDAPALNVRMGSGVDSPKIGVLFLGQSVEVVGEADDPGWLEVKATLTGAQLTGFVSRKFLREPVSDSRERLIAEAVKEWMRFDRGLGKEYTDPYYRYVGEMWSAIGSNLDGKDTDVPWSAAAISFIVRNAGAGYQEFKFAAAHARYIHESIRKRESNEDDTPPSGDIAYMSGRQC